MKLIARVELEFPKARYELTIRHPGYLPVEWFAVGAWAEWYRDPDQLITGLILRATKEICT